MASSLPSPYRMLAGESYPIPKWVLQAGNRTLPISGWGEDSSATSGEKAKGDLWTSCRSRSASVRPHAAAENSVRRVDLPIVASPSVTKRCLNVTSNRTIINYATKMGHVSRRVSLLTWSLLLCVTYGVFLLAPDEAHGDHYSGATGMSSLGCRHNINKADNSYHTITIANATNQQTRDAINQERGQEYEPTDLNTNMISDETALTDVVVYDARYNDYCNLDWVPPDSSYGIKGFTQCVKLTAEPSGTQPDYSDNECEKHELRLSLNYILYRADQYDRELACHEIGHTIGLDHRTAQSSCLHDPNIYVGNLDGHDVAAIDSHY